QGGSSECKKRINLIRHLKHYHKTRNYPAMPTSYLSPHLKFGTLSVRYAAAIITKELSPHHDLIRQLYWRDFYTYIAYHSPFVFGSSYKDKYNQLTWSKSKLRFKKWQQGLTGFPIVDAGMRQLNTTGFMHNRVRMITASFLIKDLHINWQWGERYFAQKLVDYDPSVNNGNWQWVASTGCDAAPYFRIFNPWLQQKKYDPQCIYIKQWIPELKDIPSQIIHTWYKKYSPKMKNYPYPMVNHEKESKAAIALYRSAS
ncbi:MAG: deoxyribodipyrimidine photo-lyase, partial [Candidatus Babeliales bacterium]